MDKITKILMSLIKNVVQEENIDISQYSVLSQQEEEELFQLASQHSIGGMVGHILGESNEIKKTPTVKKLMNEAFTAVYRYEQLQMDIDEITNVLIDLQIPYIILKGPKVRKYYPKPWFRTSCDIDVLIHEDDIEGVVNTLVEKYFYEKQERNYHDVSLISNNNILLELHFNIKENMDNLDQVLERVWEYSSCSHKENDMEYELSNEFFLFHLLAHMAYHFQEGGCGIRSVLDIYLIHHKMEYDEVQFRSLCKEAGIETFYDYIIQLSEVWFGGKEHTEITSAMEEYIIHGGTFGTKDNSAAVGQLKKGGHLQYMYSRIFASYDHLKGRYPSLSQHKFLMPLYQIRRWIDMIRKGRLKRYMKECSLSRNISKKQLDSTEKLLKKLKLN